jgi:hypothetical protein
MVDESLFWHSPFGSKLSQEAQQMVLSGFEVSLILGAYAGCVFSVPLRQ